MKSACLLAIWCVCVLVPGIALGAGFQVTEQGIAAMGMGMASIGRADDLSAIYHNPAGLAQSPGTHVYSTLVGISASASYMRPSFETQDNTGDTIPVPFAAFSTDFQGRLPNAVLAFAVNAPFGLANEYDEAGPQRYLSTSISLATLYLGPYIGWQVHPKIAIGGGLQYGHTSCLG